VHFSIPEVRPHGIPPPRADVASERDPYRIGSAGVVGAATPKLSAGVPSQVRLLPACIAFPAPQGRRWRIRQSLAVVDSFAHNPESRSGDTRTREHAAHSKTELGAA